MITILLSLLLSVLPSLQQQVDSLCDLAYENEMSGNFHEAIRLNKEALAMTPADSLEWISIIANNISTECFYVSELQAATEYAYLALRCDEERNDSIGISSSLNQLAVVCIRLKQYDKALEHEQRAVTIEEQLIQSGHTAQNKILAARLGIIAEIHTKTGHYEEGIEVAQRAIAIDRTVGKGSKLGVHLSQLATIYTCQQRWQEALPMLEEALHLLRDAGNIRSIIITLVPYAQSLHRLHRTDEAIAQLKECIRLSYRTGQRDARLGALHELTLMHQSAASAAYFEHYNQLRDSIYSDQLQSNIADMEVKYDTEKKELELQRQHAIVRAQRSSLFFIGVVVLLLIVIVIIAYRYARRQKEVAQEKNRMVSILSHDLKSPTVAQQRVLHLLAQGKMPGTPDILQELAKAQDKQVDLVLNMLDYARLEAGKVPLECHPLSLRMPAEDVLVLLQEQARQKHVTLRIEQDTTDDSLITTDRTLVYTIMRNLTSNAIKFAPAGTEVLIRIGAKQFAVIDHGQGFGTQAQEKGTGLGLDICRRFAQLLHARLQIDSTPEHGTTVSVFFTDNN